MSELSKEERQIVDVLCEKFNPAAIVLVGSRVDGTALKESDWDVFLFCGDRRAGVELEEREVKIDVNFSAWPSEDQYFDTGFGPVQPVKVLFDVSEGRLNQLLQRTAIAYEKGPLELQAELSAIHLRAFKRYLGKLKKYEHNEPLQFYYKGRFLDLFLTVWPEQQNRRAASPPRTLEVLKSSNPDVFDLVEQFIKSSGAETLKSANLLAEETS